MNTNGLIWSAWELTPGQEISRFKRVHVWAHKHTSKCSPRRDLFRWNPFAQCENNSPLSRCFCVWVFYKHRKRTHTPQIRAGRSARETASGKGWTVGTWSDRINEKQLDDKSVGAVHECRGRDLCSSSPENEGRNCKNKLNRKKSGIS